MMLSFCIIPSTHDSFSHFINDLPFGAPFYLNIFFFLMTDYKPDNYMYSQQNSLAQDLPGWQCLGEQLWEFYI